MATITNRSNFVVSVPRLPEHTSSFPYNAQSAITARIKELKEQGFKPVIKQLEDKLHVRIRRVGYAEQLSTFESAAAADAFIKRVESEQTQGLFIDYTAAANVTFAQLIERYIAEVCPSLKGRGETSIYMLRALVEDSTGELLSRIEKRKQEMKAFGKTITKISAILDAFRDYYAAGRISLALPSLDTAKIRLTSRPDLSGSGGPRSILAYYAALWRACNGGLGAYSVPVVIDSPNQQGQDDVNLPTVLKFIANELPKDMQLIVGLESTADFVFDKELVLDKPYSLLNEDEWSDVELVVEPLLQKMHAAMRKGDIILAHSGQE